MRLAIIGAIGVAVVSSTVSMAGVGDHVRFTSTSGESYAGSARGTHELEIDSKLSIVWNRDAFLTDLAARFPATPGDDALATKLDGLRIAVKSFLESQSTLLALKTAGQRLVAAPASGPARERAQAELFASSRAFSEVGQRAMSAVEGLRTTDPELFAALNDAILLGHGYEACAAVLRRRLDEVRAELLRRIDAAGYSVQITGALLDELGSATPVHLEGYDSIETGPPVPFARFEFTPDERTKKDLRLAEGLGDIVNDVLSGHFEEQIRDALRQLRESARALATTLKCDVLEAQLQDLEADLKGAKDESLGPLIKDVRDARDLVVSLSAVPQLHGTTDAERLIEIADMLARAARTARRVAEAAPDALRGLVTRLDELASQRPNLVKSAALEVVRSAAKDFADNQTELKKIYDNVKSIADVLGPSSGVTEAALNLRLEPKAIGTSDSLDTTLDLLTIAGRKRYPGDRLVIKIKVFRADPKGAGIKTLDACDQVFVLEKYAWYEETRGALLFADPRGKVATTQSYLVTAGLGFHFHRGIRGQSWWNRGLNPGIGATLTLLNFDDKGFELGVAGSVTLCRSLVWVGYGRDLQADANFFVLGLNPVALVGLFRGVGR